MPELKFDVPVDVREAAERGRIANHFPVMREYLIALILDADGRVSGLDDGRVYEAVQLNMQISPRLTRAINLLDDGKALESLAILRLIRGELINALLLYRTSAERVTQQRLRIRGGSSDWARAESGS